MVQVFLSVFEARRNYKVHRLSRDFEVLLCPDWIRFAQSVLEQDFYYLSA